MAMYARSGAGNSNEDGSCFAWRLSTRGIVKQERNEETQKLSNPLCKEDKEFRHSAVAEPSYTVSPFLSDRVGPVNSVPQS